MKRLAPASFLAPLLIALFGGCVNDVSVEPEKGNLLWETIRYPAEHEITCMTIDADGRIFLGAYDIRMDRGYRSRYQSSIYLSSDNGDTWARKVSFEADVSAVDVDSEGRVFVVHGEGVMRSTNHGETWETLGIEAGEWWWYNPRLSVDSNDNIYVCPYHSGVFFSGDHGNSWTQIGERIIAAGDVISLGANSRGCLFVCAGDSLYRSCDSGGSWSTLRNVPWSPWNHSLAIDSGDRVFVNDHQNVYRSTDDGETWTAMPEPGYNIGMIAIDDSDRLFAECSNRVYVTSSGVDDGAWRLLLSLFAHGAQFFSSNAAGDFFAGGDWGLSRSTDDGGTWEMLGFSDYRPSDLESDGDGSLYLALEAGGIYRSRTGGDTWERFDKGLPDVRVNCLATTSTLTLLAGTSHGVYGSPGDHAVWSRLGLAEHYVQRVFVLSDGTIAAYAAGEGLFLSADGGTTWNAIGLGDYDVRSLVRTSGGSLLAGADFGGVFRYTGEGIVWDQMNTGLADLGVNVLAVNRFGSLIAGTNAGMFLSSNDGESWRRYLSKEPGISDLRIIGDDLLLLSDKGVLLKRPGETTLTLENEGLWRWDVDRMRSLTADSNRRLYLVTAGDLYRTSPSTKELSPTGP